MFAQKGVALQPTIHLFTCSLSHYDICQTVKNSTKQQDGFCHTCAVISNWSQDVSDLDKSPTAVCATHIQMQDMII